MFKGCLAYRSAALTGQDYTVSSGLQVWANEAYDVGGWHEGVTNPSRMTIPAGVTFAQFAGQIVINNYAPGNGYGVVLYKNGSALTQEVFVNGTINHTSVKLQFMTPPLSVQVGDYFEMRVTMGGDTSIDIAAGSWFAAWKAPAAPNTFSGCVAKRTAALSAADFTTAIAVAFDDELYDVGGWHDTVTNNSRVTVPAGVSYVQLVGMIDPSAFTANQWAELSIRKNGSVIANTPCVTVKSVGTATVTRHQVITPPLAVSPGDYFELFFQTQSDASITLLDTRLWLAIWKVD